VVPMSGDVITVVVIESVALLRQALGMLLRQTPGFHVLAEVGAAADVLPALHLHRPNVALFRCDEGSESSLPLLQQIGAASERARTILVTSSSDPGVTARSIELGALGVVSWDESADLLFKAIRKVHNGEMWLGRSGTAAIITRLSSRTRKDPDTMNVESLTRREWDIVTLVAEGLKNQQIAERLCISQATVRNHLTSILDKLGVANRFELAVYAFRRGLVACPQTPAMLRRWSRGAHRDSPEPASNGFPARASPRE
jgi:DNA-binding NarL/FixJ family response regulator